MNANKQLNKLWMIVVLCAFVMVTSNCAIMNRNSNQFGSIFANDYMLGINAEAFPEYQWNEDSRLAYTDYLKTLNEAYLKNNYEQSSLLFYTSIEMYAYDARFYTRLAESLARTGDYARALNVLDIGAGNLTGYAEHPAIKSYRAELLNAPLEELSRQEAAPKGWWGKTKAVLLWVPKKIWNLF